MSASHSTRILLLAAAALLAAGTALAGTSRIPVVKISESRNAIEAPLLVPPGVTTFEVAASNTGKTQSLLLARLDSGVTYGAIRQAMQSGNMGAVLQRVTGSGGIAEAGPHNGRSWTVNLRAGDYLLVDDEANLAAPLRVAGSAQAATAPAAAGTVVFARGSFNLPRDLGDGTWKIVNRDSIEHELGLISIAPGHTPGQVEKALASGAKPAWATPVGTFNLVGPGESVWVNLRDLHGLYALVDYLPVLQGVSKQPTLQFHRFN